MKFSNNFNVSYNKDFQGDSERYRIENEELFKKIEIYAIMFIFDRRRQIAESNSKMISMKEDIIKKNEILNQKILEIDIVKRKFDDEIKKFQVHFFTIFFLEKYHKV